MARVGLTAKQALFVAEYLVDLNATQAALRAGYSARTARVIGVENLQKPAIAAKLADAMNKRAERVEVTADRIVKELARIAFADPRKVMTWGNGGVSLRESSELTDDEAALVSEVSETVTKDGGSLRLKTNDKIRALELLGKHVGMFRDGAPEAPDATQAPRVTFTRAAPPPDA